MKNPDRIAGSQIFPGQENKGEGEKGEKKKNEIKADSSFLRDKNEMTIKFNDVFPIRNKESKALSDLEVKLEHETSPAKREQIYNEIMDKREQLAKLDSYLDGFGDLAMKFHEHEVEAKKLMGDMSAYKDMVN